METEEKKPDQKTLVALVGRPNVGKSTLFNRLVGERVSIVQNEPGVTRDRIYAPTSYRDRPFILVDTGGLVPRADSGLLAKVRAQSETAIEEAGLFIFMMDGKEGLTPVDEELHAQLRRSGKPIFYAVNKTEGKAREQIGDFFRLGAAHIYPVSAEHGTGVDELMEAIYPFLTPSVEECEEDEDHTGPPRIAVLGRPNVGKSTLINALLGADRLVTSEVPGTTHDAVDTQVGFQGKSYLFIDTAGMRRNARVQRGVEQFSVSRALQALSRSDIGLLILDGVEGVTDQDAHIGSRIAQEGKGCILLVNKWDIYGEREGAREAFKAEIGEKLPFLSFAPVHFISALRREHLHEIFTWIEKVDEAARRRVTTGELNRFFEAAIERYPPPLYRGRTTRIYYITQSRTRPPTFVAFVNAPAALGKNYLRYMENQLRKCFEFEGAPIRILIRKRR